MPKTPDATLRERAAALGLYGLLARWHAVETEPWLLPRLALKSFQAGIMASGEVRGAPWAHREGRMRADGVAVGREQGDGGHRKLRNVHEQ